MSCCHPNMKIVQDLEWINLEYWLAVLPYIPLTLPVNIIFFTGTATATYTNVLKNQQHESKTKKQIEKREKFNQQEANG